MGLFKKDKTNDVEEKTEQVETESEQEEEMEEAYYVTEAEMSRLDLCKARADMQRMQIQKYKSEVDLHRLELQNLQLKIEKMNIEYQHKVKAYKEHKKECEASIDAIVEKFNDVFDNACKRLNLDPTNCSILDNGTILLTAGPEESKEDDD